MGEQMFKRDPTTATIGVEILPFEMGYLPEFFQKKGEKEINYTQRVKEESLRLLKEAIASEDGPLSSVPFSDESLMAFLTSRKFDIGRVLTQMKKFMIFKRKHDTMFKVPSFDVLAAFMTSGLVTVLPWRCQDGCTLILVQTGKCNSIQHPVDAIKQFYALVLVQCLREPMTQVNGFKIIINLKVNLEVLKICTPENLHTFYYGTQVILPARFKSIHIVDMSATGKIVWQIFSFLIPKKIKERVQIHASHDTLLDFFPRAVLPTKYGGDLKDYDMTDWLRRASSLEELKWVTDAPFEFERRS